MSKYGLKDAVNEYMPLIDKYLQDASVPIFERYLEAAIKFVDFAIVDSSFGSKDNLLKSNAFFEYIVPLVNDWLWNKYGELARNPKKKIYSGIITCYGQPVLVKIPATTIKIETPNKLAWLTFPDCLQENESINDMIQTRVELEDLPINDRKKIKSEFNRVVSMTRSINLNILSVTGLDEETANMAQGIWSHFEKSISDILSFHNQQASIGCWELHLAIEKTLKVYLKQASGDRPFGHNLDVIGKKVKKYAPDLDLSIIKTLPSDKDAIKLRYSELVTNVGDVVEYYKKALALVLQVTGKLSKKFCFNNASFLIKMAPWAK